MIYPFIIIPLYYPEKGIKKQQLNNTHLISCYLLLTLQFSCHYYSIFHNFSAQTSNNFMFTMLYILFITISYLFFFVKYFIHCKNRKSMSIFCSRIIEIKKYIEKRGRIINCLKSNIAILPLFTLCTL